MGIAADSIIFNIFLLAFIITLALLLIVYAIRAVGYWMVFSKAGEPGWKGLIPFYNVYTQYKISWNNPYAYWIYLAGGILGAFLLNKSGILYLTGYILDLITMAISVVAAIKLAHAFGHGTGYAIGLFFLGPIFLLVLGFDRSQYLGPQN